MNMSIQKRVIIYILVAGFFALSIGLVTTYYEVKEAFIRTTGRDFAEMAEKIAERFDATVKKELITFQRLAEEPAFIKAVREERKDIIGNYLRHYLRRSDEREEHINVLVVNKDGQIIGDGKLKGVYKIDQSREEWWEKTYNYGAGQFHASDIYIDRRTGMRAFDISVPVIDPLSGSVIGGIRSIMNVDVFFDFIKEMSFGRTGHGMLVDSNGTPLICSILPLVEHSMNEPLITLITSKGAGWAVVKDDAHGGKDSVIGFSPLYYMNSFGTDNLGGNKWYTFVRQAPEETFGPVYAVIFKIFILEFVLVLTISVLGVYIVRRLILKPINILHNGVERISRGDLQHRIEIHTGDELEKLANGFNRMGESLRELYNNLEQKIRERTAELIASESKYRALMEQGHDAVFIIDPVSGEIKEVNLQAEILTGLSRSDLVGLKYWDLYPDEMAASVKQHFSRGVKRGISVLHDVPIKKKDGEKAWVDVSGRMVEYSNVRVYHVVVRDISQLKKEEERLNYASEQLARSTMVMLEQDTRLSAMKRDMDYLLKHMNMSEVIMTLFKMLTDETGINSIALFEKDGNSIKCKWTYGLGKRQLQDSDIPIEEGDPVDMAIRGLRSVRKDDVALKSWIDTYFHEWELVPIRGRDIITGIFIAGPVTKLEDREVLKRYARLTAILLEKDRVIKRVDRSKK